MDYLHVRIRSIYNNIHYLLITGLLEPPLLYKTLTAVSNYVYAMYLLIAKSGKHVCLIVQNLIWNWRLDLAIAMELLILAFWNWKRNNWSAITFICVSQQYVELQNITLNFKATNTKPTDKLHDRFFLQDFSLKFQ